MKKKEAIWQNNIYVLRLIHKASPGRMPFYFLSIALGVATNFLFNAFLLRLVINSVQIGRSFYDIVSYIAAIGIILVIYYVLNNYFNEVFVPISDRIIYKNIQKQVFAKAAEVDLACYESAEFYDKYMKAVNETGQISQTVLSSVGDMIYNILTIFSVSLMIFIIDPIFIAFAIVPVIYSLLFGKKLNRLRYDLNMEMTEKTRKRDYIKRTFYLADYAKEMRLTDISNVLFGRFIEAVKELKQTIHKHGLKISILDYWAITIQWVLLFIGSIIYSTYRTVVKKTMLFGDCVIIINNIVSTASAMQGIVNGYMRFHANALSVQNIRAFLEYRSNIAEHKSGRETGAGNNHLTLDDVGFHYGDMDDPVLKNINITIKPGEKIALVGHNGAGKSTLAKLLMRLYDPVYGSISLDGIDIKEYRLSSYRNMFAAVFQQYKVFSMSIMQNILLTEDITEEDKELAVAGMKNSGIYDKVISLPKGYDMVLTKEFDLDGVIFSGGECQKIAIARVFAKPCQFVILDEPSSALDPVAEFKMYEAMMKACINKSVIYISHRLSSAVLADKVYMLENGEIAESGTHAELLARNGKYADMWHKQAEQYQYQKGAGTDA
ncbi:MAG: ABC transporter ATP-binding protein/permease [Oscillospiraceae bacterium]|nr:ABC transporter ATP-binding protein/permease [Oscillospiraceae bacterium]